MCRLATIHQNLLLQFIGCVLLAAPCGGADGPAYFRQDHGVGEGDGELPNDFGTDARRVWTTPLQPGNSTPCVHGDQVFVTTFDRERGELATVALDRATGGIRWKQVAPIETIESFHPVGSPASATPACNGERLFVFFGSYGLLCYDLAGKLLWDRKLGPFQDEFGAASSPILVDGLIILNQDHDVDSFLLAIDQRTGKTVWKTDRDGFTRSYSTPVVWDGSSGSQVIVAGSLQLAGYDAASGKKAWWVNGLSRIVDTTPVCVDGSVVLATWTPGGDPDERLAMEPFEEALRQYDANQDGLIAKAELPEESPVTPRFFRIDLNQDQLLNKGEWDRHARVFQSAQNVALRISPSGSGDLTKSVAWIHRRGLPTVPSSVVYRGILYMVKDGGIITSLDVTTGEMLKQGRAAGRGNYYASLVAADDKVYLCSERGVATVLQAGPKWEILASYDFGARIMATPVIAGGELYVRTDTSLMRIEKR